MPPELLGKIDDEIVRHGLKNERQRLDDALFNLEFYKGDFSRFPVRAPGTASAYDAGRYPRYSLVMQRVVNVLSSSLYRAGPVRTLQAPAGVGPRPYEAASAWLEGVYRRNRVNSLWQEADRLATVSEVAAFQVLPSADPKKPLRIQLWDASQLCVWCDPEDPTAAAAVATLDVQDEQRRLRLYTPEVIRTYKTARLGPGQTSAGTAYRLVSEGPNPYGLLPFSFVHFNEPLQEFWSGGPGCYLRSVNDGLNFGLTEGFDCVRYNLRPIVLLKNVMPGWRPPSPVQPGDVWSMSAATNAADEAATPADASYLQADAAFVAAGWDDISSYLDHVLEMCGVPPATVRMVQQGGRSGISIVTEQIPLVLWAEGRQRPFARYEDDLATLVLTLGARHLGAQPGATFRAAAADLEAAAADPNLRLRWTDMWPSVPGPEREQSDQWRLDNRMDSRTTLLMRRENLTRDEAETRLEEIAQDLTREQGLFGGLPAEGDPGAMMQNVSQGSLSLGA